MKVITTTLHLASWALFITLILLVQNLSAQTANQWLFQKKNTTAGFTAYGVTPIAGRAFGLDGSGNPAMLNVNDGGGLENILSTVTGDTLTFTATLTAPRAITWRDLAGTVAYTSDLSAYLTTATAASTYQPLDSDLTSIAALTTTAHGRSLLTGANTAATLASLGLSPEDDLFINGIVAGGTISATGFSGDGGGLSNLSGGGLAASSVPNTALANSTITINGTAVSLGGSTTISTGYPLTLTGGTVTTSSPLISGTQTWNAGGQVFHAADLNITSTNGSTHAAGSTLQRWLISGTPVLSIASNTTGSTEASNWRLVFGADASLGWSASWGAIMVRNAANTSFANLRASNYQATSNLNAGSYISAGSANAESDVTLSATGWRGAGLRIRNSGTITWTTGTDTQSAADIIIDIGTASPEGSVTANPGSLYLRNNSGTGEMWLKTSGTGNTGWALK